MKCTISIKDENLETHFGKKISAEEFAGFCRDAIASEMFTWQFTNNQLPDLTAKNSGKSG